MKMNEIITADEKLRLAQMIFKNTFNQLAPVVQPQPVMNQIPKKIVKPVVGGAKSKAPKKAPMAPAPKPLPKAKPVPQTPSQIKHHQQKSQQDYADAVLKRFEKKVAKMPKSLQPLPGNIISPIDGVDTDLQKKMDFVKKQADQNPSNDSLSHFP